MRRRVLCTLLALVLLLALLPVTAGAAEPTETVTLDLADDYISITPENSQGKECAGRYQLQAEGTHYPVRRSGADRYEYHRL